jgi:hypothetical protein
MSPTTHAGLLCVARRRSDSSHNTADKNIRWLFNRAFSVRTGSRALLPRRILSRNHLQTLLRIQPSALQVAGWCDRELVAAWHRGRTQGHYAKAPRCSSQTSQGRHAEAYPGFPHIMLTTYADVINQDLLAFMA